MGFLHVLAEAYEALMEGIRKGLVLLCLVAGSLALWKFHVLPKAEQDQNEWLNAVGTAILAGGVSTAVVKSLQLLHIFKKEISEVIEGKGFQELLKREITDVLQSHEVCNLVGKEIKKAITSDEFKKILYDETYKTVYARRFLSVRNDLAELWKNTAKTMFLKFPEIHDEVADTLYGYFPDHKYYLNDYRLHIVITHVRDNLIKLSETSDYVVKTTDPNEVIPLTYDLRVGKVELPRGEEQVCVESFTVDGVNRINDIKTATEVIDGTAVIKLRSKIDLSGKNEYKVHRRMTKIYDLCNDPSKFFRVRYLMKGLTVKVQFDDKLTIEWNAIGVLSKYLDLEDPKPNEINKRYDGLVFKEQGFQILIQRKEQNAQRQLFS